MSRFAAFVCGGVLVGGALYYQRTFVRDDVRMLRNRLHAAGDQLTFALSKQPVSYYICATSVSGCLIYMECIASCSLTDLLLC